MMAQLQNPVFGDMYTVKKSGASFFQIGCILFSKRMHPIVKQAGMNLLIFYFFYSGYQSSMPEHRVLQVSRKTTFPVA
jgi:hypothetical protein